jgi:hypothetical protein
MAPEGCLYHSPSRLLLRSFVNQPGAADYASQEHKARIATVVKKLYTNTKITKARKNDSRYACPHI